MSQPQALGSGRGKITVVAPIHPYIELRLTPVTLSDPGQTSAWASVPSTLELGHHAWGSPPHHTGGWLSALLPSAFCSLPQLQDSDAGGSSGRVAPSALPPDTHTDPPDPPTPPPTHTHLFNLHLPPHLSGAGVEGFPAFLCYEGARFMKRRLLCPLWLIISLKVKYHRPDF